MRLYNNPDKQERECSRCRQIKPYSEFKNRSDYPHIKRSFCKKCNIKMEADRLQMKSWTNKIHAIRLVTNDMNKCQKCNNIGIENLPMFDFHHPYPELSSQSARKIGFWKSIRYKPWSIIRNELINQKVIVICRNCHMIIQAHLFYKYKQIILENLNISSFHSIEMLDWNHRNSVRNHIFKKSLF
jgi:hypothetical protein